ncbi:MAG: hypothetical protein WC755_05495 [Candidatus Woesearchaeota archaeon]|jgi:hypothetical protein
MKNIINKIFEPSKKKSIILIALVCLFIFLHISSAICVLDFLRPSMHGICSSYRTESNTNYMSTILLFIYKSSLLFTILLFGYILTILFKSLINSKKEIVIKKLTISGTTIGFLIGCIPAIIYYYFDSVAKNIERVYPKFAMIIGIIFFLIFLASLIFNSIGLLISVIIIVLISISPYTFQTNTLTETSIIIILILPSIIMSTIQGYFYTKIPKDKRKIFWKINISIFIVLILLLIGGIIMQTTNSNSNKALGYNSYTIDNYIPYAMIVAIIMIIVLGVMLIKSTKIENEPLKNEINHHEKSQKKHKK